MTETLQTLSGYFLVFMPFLFVLLFFVRKWHSTLIRLSPFMAGPALVLSIVGPTDITFQAPGLFLNAQFAMDATAQVFLFFTSLLWGIAGLYAVFYLKDRKAEFFVYYLLAMCGNLGLILAQDVMSFYFLFALMSLSSYGLVVHSREPSAYDAGKVYMCLVVLGEAFVFSCLVAAAQTSGSLLFSDFPQHIVDSPLRNMIIFMALIGFGVKAGALPLHVWLPLAHPVAPIPASAILSGAMINAGLLGWIRIFPLGHIALPQWGLAVMILGIFAALYGVIIGLTQKKAKAVLAYSSISQMGVMTLLVGIALWVPELWTNGWPVLMFYAAHHSLSKGALFLSVGVSNVYIERPWLRALRNLGILIPALAIIGAPLTSGSIAKGFSKSILETLMDHNETAMIFKSLLILSAFATTVIMGRFLYLSWPKKSVIKKQNSVPVGVFATWTFLLAVIVSLPLIVKYQNVITLPDKSLLYFIKWSSLWPLLLGCCLSILAIGFSYNNPIFIPEGDVLVIYQKVLRSLKVKIIRVCDRIGIIKNNSEANMVSVIQLCFLESSRGERFVKVLAQWRVFGCLFLILFGVFFYTIYF